MLAHDYIFTFTSLKDNFFIQKTHPIDNLFILENGHIIVHRQFSLENLDKPFNS
jgi:hypothetical protein